MILIWGFRVRFKSLSEGEFHCPRCGGDRHYAVKQARRWFTFFFIPLIPLKVIGEVIECSACRAQFDQRVLDMPTTAAVSEQLLGAYREGIALIIRLDDSPAARERAVSMLAERGQRAWSEAWLEHDIATLDVSKLGGRLGALGDTLTEQGKERYLESLATIAATGGVLSGAARGALNEMAQQLGMTSAHTRGVIDQVLDNAVAPPT